MRIYVHGSAWSICYASCINLVSAVSSVVVERCLRTFHKANLVYSTHRSYNLKRDMFLKAVGLGKKM